MMKGEGRIYTRDLREHPEQYEKELALYRKAGQVWISYGVPFIVPIAAGFFTALIFGDILYAVLTLLAGA
jgi:preflagellin peptidase FlaK